MEFKKMAKIKLAHAATFKTDVEINIPGAEPLKVEFEFKWLSKKRAEELFALEKVEKPNAAWFKDFVAGWGFDDEMTDENIEYLLDEYPTVINGIAESWAREYWGAREKN